VTGNPGVSSYIASKHGVVGLTRTAALEYIKRGIRANAVNTGLIDTQITRDVVSGDEQAYSDIAKKECSHRLRGQAGGDRLCCAVALQSRR
jgi:NAD(P)-dependent dehydrogenase (short-subunit alcohol dehydrogenase family)